MSKTKEIKSSRVWRFNVDGSTVTSYWHVEWGEIDNMPDIGQDFEAWSNSVGWSVSGNIPEMKLTDKEIVPLGGAENSIGLVTLTFSTEGDSAAKKTADLAASINEELSSRTVEIPIKYNQYFYDFSTGTKVNWGAKYQAVETSVNEEDIPDLHIIGMQSEYNLTTYGSSTYIDEVLRARGKVNSTYLLSRIYAAKSSVLGNYDSSAPLIGDVGTWLLQSVSMKYINKSKLQYDFSFISPDPQVSDGVAYASWQKPYGITGIQPYDTCDFWGEFLSKMSLISSPPGDVGGATP